MRLIRLTVALGDLTSDSSLGRTSSLAVAFWHQSNIPQRVSAEAAACSCGLK